MTRNIGPCLGLMIGCGSLFLGAGKSSAGTINYQIGFDDLVARLGAGNVPTGANVVMAQVEAGESPGNYGPNQASSEFSGKVFTAISGPAGNSGHANSVAGVMYGNTFSVAPGVTSIYLYEANNWLQSGYLRVNQGGANPPLPTPGGIKIMNHSWAGTNGTAFDTDVLRRADFATTRDSVLMIGAINNGGFPNVALMSHSFNGITVGITPGTHVAGPTLGAIDGPGRMKPEIVAPANQTSFAAPLVDAVAAVLVQTGRTVPALLSNRNTEKPETLKAIILAGGNHRPGWTNNPGTGPNRGLTATPLDPVYGVDVVNVNRSHQILTGLEQNGADASPIATFKTFAGWDYASVGLSSKKWYRFRVSGLADKISVIATWNREVAANFGSYTLADFNLFLWRIDNVTGLATLVGNAGVPWFGGGNVASHSAVDNIEHLYITNLQPTDYMLEVRRVDLNSGNANVAVAWLFPDIPLIGDINHDGRVNVDDLLAVINAWGACPPPCPPTCPADVTGNCIVNVDDLLAVINHWG